MSSIKDKLKLLEDAHAELHRFNKEICASCCEFCEAIERVREGKTSHNASMESSDDE